ncbi:MAG TPA: putative phage abortive infection protein [Paludibacteraceae bacterium]|nr:putative phage abortive infection protein [Paludibacteraceae bacterium]HQJ90783.1 putative phage abortive infection protein [Paludibacteraceae bacterium]
MKNTTSEQKCHFGTKIESCYSWLKKHIIYFFSSDSGKNTFFTISLIAMILGIAFFVFFMMCYFVDFPDDSALKSLVNVIKNAGAGDIISLIGTVLTISTILFAFISFADGFKSCAFQERSARISSYETVFFNMLGVQQQITNEIEFNGKKGRVYFEYAIKEMKKIWHEMQDENPEYKMLRSENLVEKAIQELYANFYEEHHNIIGHYFRHLYYTIKYVNQTFDEILIDADKKIEKEKLKDIEEVRTYKKMYINIIRSQMSSFELALFYYDSNCYPESLALLEEVDFFDILSKEDLVDERHALDKMKLLNYRQDEMFRRTKTQA